MVPVRQNLVLLLAAALIASVPLFLTFDAEESFSGADGLAEAEVQRIRPEYQPWAEALWEPPSGEIESLLFSLQAALGAGLLGYYLGLRRGEARSRTRRPEHGGSSSGHGGD